MLIALSLPPWGWWPLAFMGAAVLYRVLAERSWRARALLGWLAGLGVFAIGWFWMSEFTGWGALLAILFEPLFVALAAIAVPRSGRWRPVAFPAALVLAEFARDRFPFGGVPLGGIQLGQVGGPLLVTARLGGALLLIALVALAGVALGHRGGPARAISAASIIAVALLSAVAPDGGGTGRTIAVGIVQGGGRRGLRASQNDPTDVYDAHLDATTRLHRPLQLILWPEDVVDIDGPIADAPERLDLAAIATTFDATLVAGVVEGQHTLTFRNAAVAWSPPGDMVARYEKVHRVPFGEYVPARGFVSHFANLDDVPEDAIVGHGPNVLATPAGRLGVAISYEVFFADRGRNAVAHGAELMLVPTNAASFKTSQVPTQELSAARLLAVETGRTVLQAGPTGYSAVVGPTGHVRARTTLGRRQVLQAAVALRHGRTLYSRWGDWPMLILALLAVILTAWSRFRKGV